MSLRLLNVIAHPDDECFAFGGALALAANRGVEISVLCLTDGAAGSYRGTATTTKELAALRHEELLASAKILGIAHTEHLDYHDGKLEQEPLAKLAAEVITRIRTFRPHVVLTFGLDGAANTHPDHTATAAATTAAFHWAGNPKRFPDLGQPHQPQRLFHQTTDFFLSDRYRPLPLPWTLTLDVTSVLDRKIEAFRAHTTQAPLLAQVEPVFREHGKLERYALMASHVPRPATQSTDMFEAIAE